MVLSVLIAILSILALIVLHELGHFLLAKKFNVKVEEFGVGIPPRVIGKKIGETIYSLNLLPIGAFVKLLGEEKSMKDPRSFSEKSLFQKVVIVAAGVVAFWLFSIVTFMILAASSGIPMAVEDETTQRISNSHVQVVGIAPDSPAKEAGLKLGDRIVEVVSREVDKVSEVQEATEKLKGKEATFTIQRGKETLQVNLVPRADPPEGEGPMGVALSRQAFVHYSWYEAPVQGVVITARVTWEIIQQLGGTLARVFAGKGLPGGIDVAGPIGIVQILSGSLALGLPSYLSFLATLSIYLALFNILPIPAVDGGRLFFLGLEFLRKKPLSEKFEGRVNAVSFGILIFILLAVTFRDLTKLF
ncbi:MAG: hypothetical protein Greene071421_175 [Parcubacteria group bacterium Greene0714_21]|nr:MAG: hypothetical protein Greene041639_178 [Parcubacteria group bacterium Greene0416_39]TSC97738.1 MAG: hypothetical protein Greene101447_375 [Parcubacteria group bacterium Greene1014_47]TSD04339.1 MAG: hypothetical protein Greene071421_175 [Parcubacteria group bacterium Greene0714_21]